MAKLYINRNIVKDAQKGWEFFLTGEEGISYSDVNAFISVLPAEEPIDVELYSCGGDCTEGFAIYDALRTCGHDLTTTVVGECASMATIIALCAPAESRRAFKHARFLIHEPYFPECICGDVTISRIEQLKEALEKDKEKILDIYVERTGATRAKITAQMDEGKWFDSDRAMELGFISEIVPETSASAPNEERISTTIKDDITMSKKNDNEAKSLWQRLGAILGLTDGGESPVGLSLTATDGTELTIEREEGDIQVGDKASPDGTFTLEDGRTITIQDGEITEIKQPEETPEETPEGEDEEKKALQDRVAELEKALSEAKGRAKTEAEEDIISAVRALGGMDYIKTLPVGKVKLPTNERPQGSVETNVFKEILEKKSKK